MARFTRFTVTADIVTDIASSLAVADILAGVVTRSVEALEVWECDLYEYEPESDSVRCLAFHALEQHPDAADWVGTSMPLAGQPAFRAALLERQTVALHLDDPSLAPGDRARMEAWGERSCLFVPFVSHDEVIGCLELVEKRHARTFSARDRQLAATLAALTAMALQNARLYAEVASLAISDGLTGLCNHRHFYERLGEEVARAARYALPLSLLMIDVDDFKSYNDRFGHPAGDALLRALAQLLQRETRQQIDLAARYGGDEFAVLLPSTGPEGAALAAQRLRDKLAASGAGQQSNGDAALVSGEEQLPEGARAVAERIRSSVARDGLGTGREPPVTTLSVGVASFPEHAASAEALMERADRALYAAKGQGKNCVSLAAGRADVDGAA